MTLMKWAHFKWEENSEKMLIETLVNINKNKNNTTNSSNGSDINKT